VWESDIREALEDGGVWPTRDELMDRLGVEEDRFMVLKGVFTPDGVFNNRTATGDVAVFNFVDGTTRGDEPTRYAPLSSSDAKSYE
jgi:hypothetical protein